MNVAEAADRALQSIRALPAVSTPAVRALRRQWSTRLDLESAPDVLRFAKRLLDEGSWPARLLAYESIAGHGLAFAALNDRRIDALAKGLADWGSIDLFGVTICGPAWREGLLSIKCIRAWVRSEDRWRRRFALVSTVPLNVPSRGGQGDAKRTVDICRRLIGDPDPMVVKAMSWALRALAKRDPKAIAHFVDRHRAELPAQLTREVHHVLHFGTKRRRPAPKKQAAHRA